MGADGATLTRLTIPDSLEGVARFHAVVADHADDPSEVMIGSESDRGLVIGALIASGYQLYAVNPKAADRYRDRHSVSGAKSDRGDAKILADMVRTDRRNLRRAGGNSDLGEAVRALTRTHKSLIWGRQRHVNQLRAGLREFYPQALQAFGADLTHHDAVAVLAAAPSPEKGQRLGIKQIETLLRKSGRRRNIERRATQIGQALATDQLQAPPSVAVARAATTKALVAIIAELNRQIESLAAELETGFDQHPDAVIIRSLPGIGTILGARVLAEFGDDPNRYPDAKSRKNYAATSPITRASGKTKTVTARWTKNPHLADALDRWAFTSLANSPGARHYYDQQRLKGGTHGQALRALANRLVGILHGCLKHHQPYNETIGWAHRTNQAA